MRISNPQFKGSFQTLDDCPTWDLPEFAFIGRSNVGKSSLINMLTGKKGLAKVSSTPGKTRLINMFSIDNAWSLVDLPGYGYAKVAKSERMDFNVHVSRYLLERSHLKMVFALVDARNEPMQTDMEFIAWMDDHQLPYSLVFTKTEKVKKQALADHSDEFLEIMKAWELSPPRVFHTSAMTQAGRGALLHFIETQLPKPKRKQERKNKGPKISLNWMKK